MANQTIRCLKNYNKIDKLVETIANAAETLYDDLIIECYDEKSHNSTKSIDNSEENKPKVIPSPPSIHCPTQLFREMFAKFYPFPEKLPNLCFHEIFLISILKSTAYDIETGLNRMGKYVKPIGGQFVNITESGENIVICMTSKYSDEHGIVSRMQYCLTDRHFKMIEGRDEETFVGLHDGELIKRSLVHILVMNDYLIISNSETKNNVRNTHRVQIPIPVNVIENLLLEGMMYVLKRYLVLSKFVGKFTAWCVSRKGELLNCDHIFDEPKQIKINGESTNAIRVVQKIYHESEEIEYDKYYYLPSGYMIYCEKSKYNYIFHYNPMSSVPLMEFPLNGCVILNENMEMVSKYLET